MVLCAAFPGSASRVLEVVFFNSETSVESITLLTCATVPISEGVSKAWTCHALIHPWSSSETSHFFTSWLYSASILTFRMSTTDSHHSVPPPPSTYAQFVQTEFVLFALTAKVGDITRISCGSVERSQQFESSSLGIKHFHFVYQGRAIAALR